MNTKDYLSEEQLICGIQEEGKSWLWYIEHHSDEMRNAYTIFCLDEDLDPSLEGSAVAFIEERERMFAESLEEQPMML